MRRQLLRLLLGGLPMTGDGLVRPPNAPSVTLPPVGVQAGTNTPVVIANRVIVFGPAGTAVGVFVYIPGTTPAFGNPPIAWMSEAPTDPFGNPLLFTGVGSRATGSNAFTAISAEEHVFSLDGSTLLVLSPEPSPQSGNLALRLATADFHVVGSIYLNGGNLVAIDPNNPGVPEAPHTVTPPATWAGTLTYELLAVGANGATQINCQLTNPGAAAGTINLMTLAAPYLPAVTTRWPVVYLPSKTADVVVLFSGSGVVQATIPAGTTSLDFTQTILL